MKDHSFVVGARGVLPWGLGYDMSMTRGESRADFFINNTINASLGPNTPTEFYPGSYRQRDENFNLEVDPGEKKVYFEVSDYSNTVFFESPR